MIKLVKNLNILKLIFCKNDWNLRQLMHACENALKWASGRVYYIYKYLKSVETGWKCVN